ncbi:hypothetical protein ACHAW5_008124 [Stephanodiscus triporus]|uniref:Uncharacterized protein n=1 Tax=Stephanodiscus triporus TaxID=2934178 RepID=A0ABD3NIE7_9STRA
MVGAILLPSEIMIEVLNPQPFCVYSVTILSENFYTGTAMLLAEGQFTTDARGPLGLRTCHLVYSWKSILPGQYNVPVHEIDISHDKTSLIQPPYPFLVTELAIGAGMSMLKDRILNMSPCQIQIRIIYTHTGKLENSIRTGWTFLPSSRMGCKLETFDSQALGPLPEKKSIYILGRSVKQGVFLTLADIALEEHEKEHLSQSMISKCWGRAVITKR